MEEIKCNQVAQINSAGYTEMTERVYDKNGLSPSVRTFCGGNTEVKILEDPLPMSEYELSENMKRYINSYDDKYQVSDGKLTVNKSVACSITTREGCSRADTSSYICKDLPEDANIAKMDITPYRVRKLTEKECFRLQGVKDEDFAKIRENQSKSSCYHLQATVLRLAF